MFCFGFHTLEIKIHFQESSLQLLPHIKIINQKVWKYWDCPILQSKHQRFLNSEVLTHSHLHFMISSGYVAAYMAGSIEIITWMVCASLTVLILNVRNCYFRGGGERGRHDNKRPTKPWGFVCLKMSLTGNTTHVSKLFIQHEKMY